MKKFVFVALAAVATTTDQRLIGDDRAIEGEIGAGNVDDDGLGRLDQRWVRGVVCGGNAAPQPSSAWWRGRSARPLGPQFFTRKVPVTVFVADQ
jgi:hypothetical protein